MARPADGVNGCGRPSTGGTRPAQMGHVTGGPASQPTRGAGMTTLTFTTLTFPEINQALICKSMSLAFLQSEHDKSFYLHWSPSTSKPERRAGEALHRPMGRLAGGGAVVGRRMGASAAMATPEDGNSTAGQSRWSTRHARSGSGRARARAQHPWRRRRPAARPRG